MNRWFFKLVAESGVMFCVSSWGAAYGRVLYNVIKLPIDIVKANIEKTIDESQEGAE